MTSNLPRYQVLARRIATAERAAASGNTEWAQRYTDYVIQTFKELNGGGMRVEGMPSRVNKSGSMRFQLSFTHYDDRGFPGDETKHPVVVKPSLGYGFELYIGGVNYQSVKDYLHDTLHSWLSEMIAEYPNKGDKS
jgi:hypothetical protein